MIDPRLRRVALLVAGCFFMEMLDGTIVTTSAPPIARSLSVTPGVVGIIVTAYLVTLAALIPLSGWLAARFGARAVFLSAILLFGASSLGCAASSSLAQLVVMRVVQGAGAAMMVPVGRLVVLASTAKADLMTVTAYLVWPALLAPVIAPLAGGLITTYAGWHWIFLINVPLAAAAFVAALRLIESPARSEIPPRLDRVGVLLSCGGLACLISTAGLLGTATPRWSLAVATAAGSAVLIGFAVRHLLRVPAPVVNLRTLEIPTFGIAVRGGAAFMLVVGAVPFLLPLLFEEVFRWSAVKAGSVVLFVFVGNIAIKPATSFLYSRFGFRTTLLGATTGMAATMVAVALLAASTPLVVIGAVLTLSGLARSIGGTGYSTIAFSDVPPALLRDANTLQAAVQHLSLGLGVAAASVLLQAGRPIASAVFGDRGPFGAYAVAFALLALGSLLTTAELLRLRPGAGNELRRVRGAAGAATARES